MVNKNRGNIFKPFDALEGYNEAIKKKEKVKKEKPILTSDRLEELEEVFSNIQIGTNVYIKYFKNDDFFEVIGNVTKIDTVYKKISINNEGTIKVIEIMNIIDIKII